MGDGQQQLDHLGFVGGRGIATEQQLDVVVIGVADALDGFADEGLDIRRVLANRREQGLGSDLSGPSTGMLSRKIGPLAGVCSPL
jgi:hypothetical protein